VNRAVRACSKPESARRWRPQRAGRWTSTAPDVVVTVELAAGRAFVLHRRVEGPGGLPYATAGQAVALLSGGIDSPVAAAMMMGRGLRIGVVHFHSRPFTTEAALDKVRRLAAALTRWQPTIFGVLVPFAETVQRPLTEGAPAPLRTVLARRFMLRIAARLAEEHGSKALVTGDALAQVSSQTVENLAAMDGAVPLPVFRPLLGMGKAEIVERARRLGTLAISEEEGDDCCALLAPGALKRRPPERRSKPRNPHCPSRRWSRPHWIRRPGFGYDSRISTPRRSRRRLFSGGVAAKPFPDRMRKQAARADPLRRPCSSPPALLSSDSWPTRAATSFRRPCSTSCGKRGRL
jgi:7-cyano-7-deazaguanine synthase in queuosine biosynthesis